jgi:hypothetical protein
MRFVKIFSIIVLLGFGVYFGCRYCEKRNDGFSIEKITTQFGNNPDWDVHATSEEIAHANTILNQPFHYLGHGFQCYAFVSNDGKYVLKFFRHQRLRPPVIYDWLPDCDYIRTLKKEKCASRAKRAKCLFRSFAVAFQDVPEETGLIFVHLNKTKNLHPVVTVYDKCGQKYEISLDDREFLLQHKALHCKPEIAGLMKSGKLDDAKRRIDQIFEMLVTCARKGIMDTDKALITKNNLGYLADSAIYIDSGRIIRKSSIKIQERFAEDLRRLRPLYKWLAKEYPQLAEYFVEAQKRAIESLQA